MPAKWQQWMPLYIDRFLGSMDVQTMEPPAFKAYVRLLLSAWQTDDCTVSADPEELSAYSGLGKRQWAKFGPSVMRKFVAVSVTVGDTVTVRMRNTVEFELWTEAKRIHERRRDAAEQTNATRSPRRSPSDDESRSAVRSPQRSAAHNNNPLQEQEQEQGTRGQVLKPSPSEDTHYVPVDVEPALESSSDEIPDGLSPLQYATWVLQEAFIPAGFALKSKCGEAIGMLSKLEICSMPEATQRMFNRVRDAQNDGEKVNGFWFGEDCRWKQRETAGVSIEGME